MTNLIIYIIVLGAALSVVSFCIAYTIGRLDGERRRNWSYIDPRTLDMVEQPKNFDHKIGSEEEQLEALAKNKKAPIQRAG